MKEKWKETHIALTEGELRTSMIFIYISSVESQKGVITIQWGSIENQKGAFAIQSLAKVPFWFSMEHCWTALTNDISCLNTQFIDSN